MVLLSICVVENKIKCPSSYRDDSITNIVDHKNSYLYIQKKMTISLKSNDPYFNQVQTQMFIIGFQFCEIFDWTKKDNLQITIEVDEDIQVEITYKTKNLLCKVPLPELTSKYFIELKLNDTPNLNSWCIWKMDETKDNLIICEDNTFKITYSVSF